ncbi:MAG: ABC transporter ATP-binding protein [Candidatus Diapherotrites archaeon]|nr:ABC transporter ATP-binding protein [Candidatus Diapherotrites archaeon]
MRLEVRNLEVNFPGWKTGKISFTAPSGGFLTILGPTGSGKSTILKAIAGIVEPSGGNILFDGASVNGLPAEKRNVGMVFQNNALFPHLNVLENVAFGLKTRKEKKWLEKTMAMLEMLGVERLAERGVKNLSGGEEKLVAICRALVTDPAIMLFDEPLNGLDALLREKLKKTIRETQQGTGKTTVFVTHDVDEAFFLSDRIIVLNNGRIEQVGAPGEIFEKPATKFVREFVEGYSIVKARVEKGVLSGKFEVQTGLGDGEGFLNLKKNNFRKT